MMTVAMIFKNNGYKNIGIANQPIHSFKEIKSEQKKLFYWVVPVSDVSLQHRAYKRVTIQDMFITAV